MFAPSAPGLEPSIAVRERQRAETWPWRLPRTALSIARVGYLAPASDFDGIVHSVFARSCNIACKCGLLTVAVHDIADGPTVWRLANVAAPDFRRIFSAGDRLRRRGVLAATRGIAMSLATAEPWRAAPPPHVSSDRLAANLAVAAAALGGQRRARSSVVDRDARRSVALLEDACLRLDIGRATVEIDRLVGLGEGLTPAGDDLIVGLLAALRVLCRASLERASFVRSLSATVRTRASRTAVLSGHYLRLAADGHFNADVTRLAHAFVSSAASDDFEMRNALDAAFVVGATSGADMVSGMIAGFRAWAANEP